MRRFYISDGRFADLQITIDQYAKAWALDQATNLEILIPVFCPDGTYEYMRMRTFQNLRLTGFRNAKKAG